MNWGLALGIVLIFVGLFWILLELVGLTKVDNADELEKLRKEIQQLKRELENKQ